MLLRDKKIVIAIDGYSSCGKSTIAKSLASKLGYIYIDSGAMYRAVTLFALRNNLVSDDKVNTVELASLADKIIITFRYCDRKMRYETYLNGENIEDEIRDIRVSDSVSAISKIAFVRKKMVKLQQQLGGQKGIVMDGRDIGTVVFPDADLKIFMTANADVRAERRFSELKEKGSHVSLTEIKENIMKRDHTDETRTESPLRKADDAIVLDNSNLTRAEQLDWILNIITEKFQ